MPAAVDAGRPDGQRGHVAGVPEGSREIVVEGFPHFGPGRVAPDRAVFDRPALFVAAPSDDLVFEPVVLGVDAGGEQHDAGREIGPPLLEALEQAQRVGRCRSFVVPQLAQLDVPEGLGARRIVAHLAVLDRELGHGVEGRQQSADVEAGRLAIPRRRRAPLALGDHRKPLGVVEHHATMDAD